MFTTDNYECIRDLFKSPPPLSGETLLVYGAEMFDVLSGAGEQ